jgi:lipopolysaccharide transport system ATP-binding protein
MTPTVIRVENLGKEYAIGSRLPASQTFREMLVSAAATPMRHLLHANGNATPPERIWALKNVNFQIRKGEIVGVVGRNGAGKSTLLKILSRITPPTEGRAKITGRVSSLLEVGTGFHPELTGRENVYLNGAILGMGRAEISRKFDAIVEFSGVERFLDTPVKRYSSGMSVRLAFSVAAHLDPEILIVDEVLAVGDIEFQKKCLCKMQDVAGAGRTVLFVSHNLATLARLCSRGLLLDGGRVALDGSIAEVIAGYTSSAQDAYSIQFPAANKLPSIVQVDVDPDSLGACDLVVDITFESPWPLDNPVGGLVLRASTGEPVWGTNARIHPVAEGVRGITKGVLRCEARALPVASGDYVISVWLGDWQQDYDSKLDILSFNIGSAGSSDLRPSSSVIGHLDWPALWNTQRLVPPIH